LLLANLEGSPREVTCRLRPERLPHPLAHPAAAMRLSATAAAAGSQEPPDAATLDIRQLIGEGLKITIPGDDAILIQVR
jgi:hypothetical protein